MERIMKTARVSKELSGVSLAKVANVLEHFAFQQKSINFLRSQGETDAADKLEEKAVWDLGKEIALIVDPGFAKRLKKSRNLQADVPAHPSQKGESAQAVSDDAEFLLESDASEHDADADTDDSSSSPSYPGASS